MVVSAAIAKAKLQYGAAGVGNEPGRHIQAITLRHDAANEPIETTVFHF
jgi:hypothetical protein